MRLLVGGYFIYASLDKIADPYTFARVIESYQFSQETFINILDLEAFDKVDFKKLHPAGSLGAQLKPLKI